MSFFVLLLGASFRHSVALSLRRRVRDDAVAVLHRHFLNTAADLLHQIVYKGLKMKTVRTILQRRLELNLVDPRKSNED